MLSRQFTAETIGFLWDISVINPNDARPNPTQRTAVINYYLNIASDEEHKNLTNVVVRLSMIRPIAEASGVTEQRVKDLIRNTTLTI